MTKKIRQKEGHSKVMEHTHTDTVKFQTVIKNTRQKQATSSVKKIRKQLKFKTRKHSGNTKPSSATLFQSLSQCKKRLKKRKTKLEGNRSAGVQRLLRLEVVV